MVKKKVGKSKASKKECCTGWHGRTKNFNYHDIKFIKLSSIAFAFFLLAVWPRAWVWVGSVHWGWFLGAMIILAIKPWISFWGKKK